MNLIAPFGFYGWGNIGDESTLQGFARLVSASHSKTRVWVGSRSPAHTKRVEPFFRYFNAVGRDPWRNWARYRSQACVVPGGTPIMDVLGEWPLCELAPIIKETHDKGKPAIFVGSGTERLLRDDSKRIMADILAPRVEHWSVRCDKDKERLAEYGVPEGKITVAADLAWMLEAVAREQGREYLRKINLDADARFVGVNINNERFIQEKEPQFFEKVASLFDRLITRFDYQILFLCNEVREEESFDKFASQKVQSLMSKRNKTVLVPNIYRTPQEMLSLIGCCDLTIGMRYHFCLFSALQDIPFIAIKRSGKVADLCWDMNWPYAVELDEIDPSALLEMFVKMQADRECLVGQLKRGSQKMRERASMSRIVLERLVMAIRVGK